MRRFATNHNLFGLRYTNQSTAHTDCRSRRSSRLPWRSQVRRVVPAPVAAAAMFLLLVLAVSAQGGPVALPGDPQGPEDLVFVDLDSSRNITCGVTAAENLRCWGENRFAPMRAEGFVDVATGLFHTCGLRLDGTVQCWGASAGNRLNVPSNDDTTAIEFIAIDAQVDHTCGIRADNDRVVCWGWDTAGQASGRDVGGNYSYDYSEDSFARVTAGENHSCGILKGGADAGKIRCWGGSIFSSENYHVTPEEYKDATFVSVELGTRYTCGLIGEGADSGKAICWGSDYSLVVQETPADERFRQISSGTYHVCGIKTNGSPYCWGGMTGRPAEPQIDFGQVDVPAEHADKTFTKIIAGQYHTCGILDNRNGQTAGEVVCWGAEFDHDPLNPSRTEGGRTRSPDIPYPPTGASPQLGAGWYFNCALTIDRDLMCWGGSTLSPSFVEGPFETLAVGALHVCAVKAADGRIMCWGFDNNHQASGWANNSTPSLAAESKFVEDLTTRYSFKFVAANLFHTCGLLDGRAGGADGTAVCWALNANGQSEPPTDATFSTISVGYYHGCGLLDDRNGQSSGRVACWGADEVLDANGVVQPTKFGFDPRADFGQATVPENLVDETFASISAGRYHTCAVRADNGAVECWGRQELSEVPIHLRGAEFVSVSVSASFSCGITSNNRVKCWGPEMLDRPDSTQPVPNFELGQHHVPDDFVETEFVAVSASRRHVCATQANGNVFCWGADADPSTPQIDIYTGSTIVNTRQAWVPASFRTQPRTEKEPPTEQEAVRFPASSVRVLRIEPSIRGVSLRLGVPVRLSVEVYGRQDIRDDSLADRHNVTFEWTTEELTHQPSLGVGRFSESPSSGQSRPENGLPDDRRVIYHAPVVSGRYLVTAIVDPGTECVPKRAGETEEDVLRRCSAVFEVTVLRSSAAVETKPEPRNPAGAIPTILTDSDGNQYEVFTPEGGGTFTEDTSSLKAGPGVVPNGEVVGLRISEGGSASNEGKTYQRYNLGGSWYEISVVDASNTSVSSYGLSDAVEVCIPLPDALRSNISDLALVAVNSDGSLTILSSIVRISASGTKVCGNLSSIPAKVAVGTAGSPAPLPTEVPDAGDASDLPETGGAAPSSDGMLWALMLGLAIVVSGYGVLRAARRRNDQMR